MQIHTSFNISSASRAILILHLLRYILTKHLLYFCPAFLFSCTAAPNEMMPEEIEISLKRELVQNIKNTQSLDEVIVDIFIYDNDKIGHLDSYQRLKGLKSNKIQISSTSGEKEIFMIVNPQWDTYEWNTISSREGIGRLYADLRKDNGKRPLMTGKIPWSTKESGSLDIELKSMLSQIRIRSLRCDFSSRPYRDADLENVNCWLVNANTLSEIGNEDFGTVLSPVNTGGFPEDIDGLDPEMLKCFIGERVGKTEVHPDKSLYCYPGSSPTDNNKTPQTLLVLSGEIHGHRYYYPIGIGNIRRNCRYEFDIVITRAGSSAPLHPISAETINVSCKVMPWDKKEETVIPFSLK